MMQQQSTTQLRMWCPYCRETMQPTPTGTCFSCAAPLRQITRVDDETTPGAIYVEQNTGRFYVVNGRIIPEVMRRPFPTREAADAWLCRHGYEREVQA